MAKSSIAVATMDGISCVLIASYMMWTLLQSSPHKDFSHQSNCSWSFCTYITSLTTTNNNINSVTVLSWKPQETAASSWHLSEQKRMYLVFYGVLWQVSHSTNKQNTHTLMFHKTAHKSCASLSIVGTKIPFSCYFGESDFQARRQWKKSEIVKLFILLS